MKIGDIKVGTIYGAINKRARHSRYGDLPRRVEALEIVTVEQPIWKGGGFSQERGTRNVRHVRIRCLDVPLRSKSQWEPDTPTSAAQDTELVVGPEVLVAPWSELRADVSARVQAKQDEADAVAEYERRIKAVLPKGVRSDWFYVSANATGRRDLSVSMKNKHAAKGVHVDVKVSGRVLDCLLDMAERGASYEANPV